VIGGDINGYFVSAYGSIFSSSESKQGNGRKSKLSSFGAGEVIEVLYDPGSRRVTFTNRNKNQSDSTAIASEAND